jgi:hypothetical protein
MMLNLLRFFGSCSPCECGDVAACRQETLAKFFADYIWCLVFGGIAALLLAILVIRIIAARSNKSLNTKKNVPRQNSFNRILIIAIVGSFLVATMSLIITEVNRYNENQLEERCYEKYTKPQGQKGFLYPLTDRNDECYEYTQKQFLD